MAEKQAENKKKRRNVTVDDATWEAAQELAGQIKLASLPRSQT
jgi:hypothetical protein